MSETPSAIKHLLVVDDDSVPLSLTRAMLENNGYTVTSASNGVEALKSIMGGGVDAIICDLMMPRMAGDIFYGAVERLNPQLTRKFIFSTSNEGNPRFADFLKRVNPVVLAKPITLGKLLGGLMILAARSSDSRRKR